ncbi:MAG: hypothetical protein GY724_20310 [Actinomycetia bacterium]|nr:hypothetical protein [Actinomycetes bacterium]
MSSLAPSQSRVPRFHVRLLDNLAPSEEELSTGQREQFTPPPPKSGLRGWAIDGGRKALLALTVVSGGHGGEEDLAGADVDEEQHVVGAEQGGVDTVGLEDLSHGGGGDPVAEADEFAVDAAVAPGRLLRGEAEDELSDPEDGGWLSRSPGGLCPMAGDSALVPSQEGVGGESQPVRRGGGSAAVMVPRRLRSAVPR